MTRRGPGLFVYLLVLLAAGSLTAIAPESAMGQDISWTRQFGTEGDNTAEDMVIDGAGNLYVVGSTDGPLAGQSHLGSQDAYLKKYDGQGNELWVHQFGTELWDSGAAVAMDGEGSLYVIGTTLGSQPGQASIGGQDAYLCKYNNGGNEVWTRQFGTPRDDPPHDVGVDGAGGIYVAGKTNGALPGHLSLGREDSYLRKYDGDGKEIWTRQFGTAFDDDALAVEVDAGGNIYVVGGTWGDFPGQTNIGGRDAYLRKYDSDGNEAWTHQFGTNGRDDATAVALDGSGNLYVIGDTPGSLPGQTNLGRYDAYLRKYDDQGRQLWTRQFGSQHFDLPWDVVEGGGNVYVAGWTRGSFPGQAHLGNFDAFVSGYDGEGNHLWSQQFGTEETDQARRVLVDAEGDLYLIGHTQGALPGQTSSRLADAFVLKMSGAPSPTASTGTRVIRETAPEIAWTRQFGTAADDFVLDMEVDGKGDLYVVGHTLGLFPGQTDRAGQDGFLRKYNSGGNELWTRQFGGDGYITAVDLEVDSAGHIYVVGHTWSALPGQANLGLGDPYLINYDGDGNETWTRQFGTELWDTARRAAVDQEGNVYVVGQTEGILPGQTKYSLSGRDAYIVKYDIGGSELWIRQFGVPDFEGRDTSASWVAVDTDGNVYVAGDTEAAFPGQNNAGARDIFLRKYDAQGNELWTKQFGTQDDDTEPALAVDGVGNVYVVGRVDGAFAGQTNLGLLDAYIRKYDAVGSELWTRQFGTQGSDYVYSIDVDESNNLYVVGRVDGALPGQISPGGSDAYLRSYDSDGSEKWTRQFGTADADFAQGVAVDAAGNIYVVGRVDGAFSGQTNQGGVDAFIMKVQPAATLPAPSNKEPSAPSGGGCIAPLGAAARSEAGWLLMALLWAPLALAAWSGPIRKRRPNRSRKCPG